MAERQTDQARLVLQREYARRPGTHRAASVSLPRSNFIDELLFDRMQADGVSPAPLSSDAEFLRRVYIDLTGRIPQPDKVTSFLADSRPDKRARLIDELLASDAYVAQFALYFSNRFQVARGYASPVRKQGRNLFYNSLVNMVRNDLPYDAFVRDTLSARGDADEVAGVNFYVRSYTGVAFNPVQDFWDTTTDVITTQFLGVQTQCISCHNGRGHLEKINLYLAPRRRSEFWETAAFLSRTKFLRKTENDGAVARLELLDSPSGAYLGAVDPSNPGNRPARIGANVPVPKFLLTGELAGSENWRSDFANIIVNSRQFARASVNYIWAYMFRTGIVDPPNAWDLARIDPDNPPPGEWPLQITNRELLEKLTDFYIENGYRLKPLLRLIVNSTAWQLSSRYNGNWQSVYASYFARHNPRRLSAEELYDALTIATQTESPLYAVGYSQPFYYANELPDPSEPVNDYDVRTILASFGRGDDLLIDRNNSPSLPGLLTFMNDYFLNQKTKEPGGMYVPINRAARIAALDISEEEAVRQLYVATLTRLPTAAEMDIIQRQRGTKTRAQMLARLQWVLVNKLDFIFNY